MLDASTGLTLLRVLVGLLTQLTKLQPAVGSMEGSSKLNHEQAPLQQEAETKSPGLCIEDITMAVAAGLLSPQ